MAINFTNRFSVLRNSTALTRPLFLLGTASALLGSTAAHAFDANSLPQGGTVTGGSATVASSGNTLTVNQSSTRAIIDWRSFNIGANAQANFNQPGTSSIAVNRVNGATDPSRIEGGLHANGQVWILNPNGVLFGKTARVDAAGVVATTANIDDRAFMAGSNRLQMTGGDTGQVVNEGHITVGQGGLAAFVAPSVRNSGVIRARVGRVTLAAGDTYTLDLAGDRLVELGVGSGHAVVDQSGKIVNPGGIINISAKAAGQVVDSLVNISGVTSASSVKTAGGQIILGGDEINVASTATTSADGTSGGQITAIANKTGNYAGSYSAQGTTGDGGQIETSGHTVTVAADARISASSAHGKAGKWILDPVDVTIQSGAGGGTVTTGTIEATLAGGTSVDISTQSGTGGNGDLTLANSVNATSTSNAGLTLTGRHLSATGGSTINIAGGAVTLNVNAVNNTSSSTGWIGDAIGMVGTISGGSTVNVGAGTYNESVTLNKANLTLHSVTPLGAIIDAGGAAMGINVATNAGNLGSLTVDGFTVKSWTSGGIIQSMDAGSVAALHVTNNAVYGPDAGATAHGNGIEVTGNGSSVSGNHVYSVHLNSPDWSGSDIVVANGSNITVENNVVDGDDSGIAITNWNNTAGMTGIIVRNNTISNVAEGISVQTHEGEYFGLASGGISGLVITGNTVTGNQTGLGVWDYSNAHDADWASTIADVSGNTFSKNDYQISTDFTGADLKPLVGTNHFDASAVNHAGGQNIYGNLGTAVGDEAGGSTLDLAGTFTLTSQLEINKNITLQSNVENRATIAAGADFTGNAASAAMILVDAGKSFTLKNMKVDGTGHAVGQALRSQGNTTVDNVAFSNIADGAGSYGGAAIVSIGGKVPGGVGSDTNGVAGAASLLTVTNSTFSHIGREGILVKGNGATANIDGITYTGKGNGDWLDYGVEAGAGAHVTLTNSTITGNTGVTSNDGSTSSGVLVTSYYGPGTQATLTGNTITDNSAAVGQGYDEFDASVVHASGNDFTDNGVVLTSALATADYSKNYWGSDDAATISALMSGDAAASVDFSPFLVNGKSDFSNLGVTALGGGDAHRIQEGIDDVAAGGTVNVGDGTYNESVLLNKANLTLHSNTALGAIIDAGGAATAISVATNAGNLGSLTVDGFTVKNWTSGGIIQSMDAGPLASLHVTNNDVYGPSAGATSHGNGIEVTGNGSSVSGNQVHSVHLNSPDWSGSDIVVANGSNIIVEDNVVDGDDSGIAVTNWNNTAGMTGITIRNNTISNVAEGISVQTHEGEYFGLASGGISDLSITGNVLSNNETGLGVWDYSNAHDADWASTFSDVSNNSFSNNDYQVSTDFTGADLKPLVGANNFDRTVLNDTAGQNIYGDLGTAIASEAAGSTLDLTGAFTLTSQLEISNDLTLQGVVGNRATISAGADFAGNAAANAMILVDTGVNFTFKNLKVDGSGHVVGQGLRSQGNTTVDNADFANIGSASSYNGVAIASIGGTVPSGFGSDTNSGGGGTALLTVSNTTFENIGREGILVKGDDSTANIDSITYTGKGDGDWIDYAVEAGAGGHVNLTNSTITGNTGVAYDGSTSSGVLVTSYYGPGTEATLIGNTITGNSFAVGQGFDSTDESIVHAHGNDFSGNGVELATALGTADYSQNYWGTADATAIAALMDGAEPTSVDFSPFLVNGKSDFSHMAVTNLGAGGGDRIAEGLAAVDAGGILDVNAGTYAEDVALTAPLTVNFDDVTLNSLTVTTTGSGSTLSGNVTAGSVTAFDINLGGDLSLDTHATNGTIVLGNVNGTHDLTLNAGAGVALVGGMGDTTRLGAVNITADLIGLGETNNAASFVFNGDVALAAPTTVIDTTVSATAAGDITFGGDILGFTDGGQSLTLRAGPGTGDKSANGDIAMNNAGLSAVRLGNMVVSGDDFTALTVDLAGNFSSQLSGNQVFAADTLNAGGNVVSNVAGDATGHIVAAGNVTMDAGGNVSGTIAGNDVSLTAGQGVSGNITGQTVTLIGQSVNGQVNAKTLNVNAQSGTVTGTFTLGTVSNGLLVNGQTTGASTGTNTGTNTGGNTGTNTGSNQLYVNGQQLVVQNFVLPIGTQIGADGQLILPPGTVIGLLSPGGGPARVIMVSDVQTLGQLLSEGYVAIVIDLKSKKKKAPVQVALN